MITDEAMERVVLGSILIDGTAALEHCGRLREEMFGLDSHRTIYRSLLAMLRDQHKTDILSLVAHLKRERILDAIGGRAYLTDLDFARDPAVLERYTASIVTHWKRRRAIALCSAGETTLLENGEPVEVLTRLQQGAFEIMQEGQEQDSPLVGDHTDEAWEDFCSVERSIPGMTYGLTKLDEKTAGGMREGEVTIVGARNGVGKSRMMIQAAYANASQGVPVDVFSHEMSRKQVMRSLMAIESGVAAYKIRRPILASAMERQYVEAAYQRMRDWPLRIYDENLDISQVIAHARMDIRNHGVKLVCEDYAQIVPAEGRDERLKVGNVSRSLTALAKHEGVHVMLLSQCRKVPPEQYRNPPMLLDLRESGQLGDDGHTVIMIHRAYDSETSGLQDHGEIILCKQREGQTGAFPVRLNTSSLRFEEV